LNAIALHGVTLGYRGHEVLSGIDLAIEQGEFVGLFGANGAGKTTLLQAILGLIQPTLGTIEVLGRPAATQRCAMGSLPQSRATAWPRVRGWDLLAASLNGARWGLPHLGAAGHAAIGQALEEAGASELASRPIGELSGGERQRLLIAQALLGTPRILLLDEPLAGLDPRHQRDVVDLLSRLQRGRGLTVLCSAHDLNVLGGAMDRVLFVGRGQAALGTAEEVVTGPVLTRLYGAPVEVLHARGRIFVGA
jgi:zinc/manganese transport system ATP-binding protein